MAIMCALDDLPISRAAKTVELSVINTIRLFDQDYPHRLEAPMIAAISLTLMCASFGIGWESI